MKVNFVPIDAAIADWKEDNEFEAEIDEGLLRKWAQDCVKRVSTDEQTIHSVALLHVDNYKTLLPKGFKMLCQLAYKVSPKKTCGREEIVQWTKKVWGSECELEINLKCPDCHKEKCDCNSPVVTLNVDEIWSQANPQVFTSYMKHFHNFGKSGYSDSSWGQDFKLMRPRVGNFDNLRYHISNCPNLKSDCEYVYDINPPEVVVNFKKGQLLISYFAEPTDDEGYPLIPNTALVFDAIRWKIQERMMYRRYLKEIKKDTKEAWQDSYQLYTRAVAMAKAELQIPDADTWYNKMRDTWSRNWPKYDWWEASSQYTNDKYGLEDETYQRPR